MSRATKVFKNIPKCPLEKADAVNRDGYPAFTRPVEEQILQTLLTNTFGNTFYATQKELIGESAQIHDAAFKADPEFYARALVYARDKGHMRTQPVYGLAKLAHEHGKLFPAVFDQVVRTPNDLADFMVMYKSLHGNHGGRVLKRVVGNWLAKNLSEYWVIKYGSENHDGYSLRDLVQLSHPNVKDQPLFDYIMRSEYTDGKVGRVWNSTKPIAEGGERAPYRNELRDVSSLKQIGMFEAFKRAETDEQKVMLIKEGRLPHEVVTGLIGDSKPCWDALVANMPIFALMRNLATLERHGVLEQNRKLIEGKLTSREVIEKSQILPFRFLDAFDKVSSGWLKDALREALELSFVNIPDVDGDTTVAVDISGSMDGKFLKVAAIYGISLMKKAKLHGRLFQFDTRLDEVSVSMRDSTLTQAERFQARGGTNTALVMDALLHYKIKTDNVVLITDEQQNTGCPFVCRLEEYRQKINRKLKCFVIDVSPYAGGALAHPDDKLTQFCYGWSDQILSYVSLSSRGWDTQVQAVRDMKLG
ncbi:MAG: TROVE domain-containing protein [Syntrophorhabdaceae bacterium]|nr:TROVE domain-containing protein [Syntrophorhabdaceae bacterium]